MEYLTGETLLKKNEEVSADEVLKDKEYIAFYNSQGMRYMKEAYEVDQMLGKIYEEIKEKELSVEIIFMAWGVDEEDFNADMKVRYDWLTLPPYSPASKRIRYKHYSQLVPHLVVLKRDGTVVSTGGCCCIKLRHFYCLQDWCYQRDPDRDVCETCCGM